MCPTNPKPQSPPPAPDAPSQPEPIDWFKPFPAQPEATGILQSGATRALLCPNPAAYNPDLREPTPPAPAQPRMSLFEMTQEMLDIMAAAQDAEEIEDPADREACLETVRLFTEQAAFNLNQKHDAYIRIIKTLEYLAEGQKAEAANLALRAKRNAAAADRLKVGLCQSLIELGKSPAGCKFESASGSLKMRKGNVRVEVTVPSEALPEAYQRHIPAKVEPDKVALKRALSAGEEINGAELVEGPPTIVVA